jgi:hypothetical protein
MKNQKKLLVVGLSLMMLVWTGCASTKNVIPNYLGTWTYSLDTPQGTTNGYMKFTNTDEVTIGVVGSEAGETGLSNLSISTEKVYATFYYESYEVQVNGVFTESVLEGTMSAAGYDMPFKALKQSSE